MDTNDPIMAKLERTRRAYDRFRCTAIAPDFARLSVRPLRGLPVRTLAAAAAVVLCAGTAALVLHHRPDFQVERTPIAALRRPGMPASLDMPYVPVYLDFGRVRSGLARAKRSYPWLGRVPAFPDLKEPRNTQTGSTG
jgi:hypothetical protein